MSRRKALGWQVAGLFVLLGLIGSGFAVLAHPARPGGRARSAAPGADAARRPVAASPSPATGFGVQLLAQAVAACRSMSYRGVQVVSWRAQGSSSSAVVDVWHQPERMTVVQAAGPSTPPGSPPPGTAGYRDPVGILGVSAQLLGLLRSNYQVAYAGHAAAAGRDALVVDISRPRAGLAARFFIDAATKLPLRRELYDRGSHLISVDAFTGLTVGQGGLGSAPAAAAAPMGRQLDAAALTSLRAQGWPLPASLPGNLSLLSASRTPTRSGKTVGLSYSDGLSVVSLFIQRGALASQPRGWLAVPVAGRTVYADAHQGGRSLCWPAGGYVYTLIADAPAQTISQVVTGLPGDSAPGFWHRMGNGLRRLGSWADPLGH